MSVFREFTVSRLFGVIGGRGFADKVGGDSGDGFGNSQKFVFGEVGIYGGVNGRSNDGVGDQIGGNGRESSLCPVTLVTYTIHHSVLTPKWTVRKPVSL